MVTMTVCVIYRVSFNNNIPLLCSAVFNNNIPLLCSAVNSMIIAALHLRKEVKSNCWVVNGI